MMDALNLLELPDMLLEKIIGYLSFDEIASLRIVCQKFNEVNRRLLNKGFRAVEKFHSQCLKEVKSQLPRRESERRDHPLSPHCNILSGIETRLSLLNMTFLKYIDAHICCFIPGKVIDEVYRVLRFVQNTKDEFARGYSNNDYRNNAKEMRANIILKELRDISSMAMEHFEEKIQPNLKSVSVPSTFVASASPPHFSLSLPSFVSLSPVQGISHGKPIDATSAVSEQVSSLSSANKQNKTAINGLKKQLISLQHKYNESQRKISELEQVTLEANRVISEQTSKISDHENKLFDMNQKLIENEQKIASFVSIISQQGIKRDSSNPSSAVVERCVDHYSKKLSEGTDCLSETCLISPTQSSDLSCSNLNPSSFISECQPSCSSENSTTLKSHEKVSCTDKEICSTTSSSSSYHMRKRQKTQSHKEAKPKRLRTDASRIIPH